MSKTICPACKKEFDIILDTCTRCEYPFNGTDKEKSIHLGQFILKKSIVRDSEESIEKNQRILYLIASLTLLSLIASQYRLGFNLFDVILNSLIILLFFWSGYTLKKEPFMKTLLCLSIFIFIVILNSFIDPNTIFHGVIWKLFVVGALGYSLYLIKSSENFNNKYKK